MSLLVQSPMLIKEMYEYCMKHEESIMAHYILHSLQTHTITIDDDISALPKPDMQEVLTMAKQNILGFSNIKVYALKDSPKTFIFILAKSKEDAIEHYTENFMQSPLNCVEYPMDYLIFTDNQYLTFETMKEEIKQFPAIAGKYERK